MLSQPKWAAKTPEIDKHITVPASAPKISSYDNKTWKFQTKNLIKIYQFISLTSVPERTVAKMKLLSWIGIQFEAMALKVGNITPWNRKTQIR